MAIAIEYAREKGLAKRFAIIDTDTHHGDGTREIFNNDEDILHICYCGWYGYEYEYGGKKVYSFISGENSSFTLFINSSSSEAWENKFLPLRTNQS